MLRLMNNRTGPMKGLLSQKALENFEKGMWAAAQANSKLLSVARDEADLAKYRVWEARRALYPALTARARSARSRGVAGLTSAS